MFMEHNTSRLVENLPSALPCHEAQISVFIVEGPEEMVKTAQFLEFPAVEGAGTATRIEAGENRSDCVVDPMPNLEPAVLPPSLGEAGFLPALARIRKEDLAGDGENLRIAEVHQQRLQEIRLDSHVAVEKDDNVVFSRLKTRV